MRLSDNFTLQEATRSTKAVQLGIDNSMDAKTLLNAEWFAQTILQPLRTKVRLPFIISSWYRSPGLNKAVGGVATSAHLSGMAIDFTIQGHTAKETYVIIKSILEMMDLPFDQLLLEHNTKTGVSWVHLGVKKTGNRKQTIKITV